MRRSRERCYIVGGAARVARARLPALRPADPQHDGKRVDVCGEGRPAGPGRPEGSGPGKRRGTGSPRVGVGPRSPGNVPGAWSGSASGGRPKQPSLRTRQASCNTRRFPVNPWTPQSRCKPSPGVAVPSPTGRPSRPDCPGLRSSLPVRTLRPGRNPIRLKPILMPRRGRGAVVRVSGPRRARGSRYRWRVPRQA